MSDLMSVSQQARRNLAHALVALNAPDAHAAHLINVLEPIAQALFALARFEVNEARTGTTDGQAALNAVRSALAKLQDQPGASQAIEAAMEGVAGSLGLVHQLAQAASRPPPAVTGAEPPWKQTPNAAAHEAAAQEAAQREAAAQEAAERQAAARAAAEYARHIAAQEAAERQAAERQAAARAAAELAAEREAAQRAAAAAAAAAANFGQAPQYAARPEQHAERHPVAPPKQPAVLQRPLPHQTAPEARVSHIPTSPRTIPPEGALQVDAELGAHSSTNFYKGLSGNDVIDSGGIFIATYRIPEMGRDLWIRLSLPGGYEFSARGVVSWTREASTAGSGADPGFGARFTEITPEGRQLVYRYVRNREPLFHDDL